MIVGQDWSSHIHMSQSKVKTRYGTRHESNTLTHVLLPLTINVFSIHLVIDPYKHFLKRGYDQGDRAENGPHSESLGCES